MPNVYRAVGALASRRVQDALQMSQVVEADEGLVGRPEHFALFETLVREAERERVLQAA